MAAGTHVCHITNSEIDNNSDVVGVVDCNASTKPTDAHVNVTGDSDSSYQFLHEEVTPDPVFNAVANNCLPTNTNRVQIHVVESGGDVDCFKVESDSIVSAKLNGGEVLDDDVDRGTHVANEEVNGSIVAQVFEPVCVDDGQVTDAEVVDLESSPKAVENVEFQVSVSDEVNELMREPVYVDGQVTDDEVVELESSPKAVENVECQVSVSDEVNGVRETAVEASEAQPVFESEEVRETVIEPALVVEAKEVREPVVETFESASVVEVLESREPVVEAESVVETQDVRESVEAGGAMAMPEVVSQTSERKVTLEADGSKLPEDEEVGDVKTEDKPELSYNGQVDESEESHLASRSVADYEEKVEEENMTEIGNQQSPVLFMSEVDRSINEGQMGTPQSEDIEDDQVPDSADFAQLEAETVVDPAFVEDQVSTPEEVSEQVFEHQKDTQPNVDHIDSQVLSSVDLVRSGTENETEDPLEVGDPTINEFKHSEAEDVRECVDECLNGIQLNESTQNAQLLPPMACVGLETEKESEAPPETVIAGYPTLSENQASLIEEDSKWIGESQKNTHLNKGPEVVQSLPSAICVRSETMDETESDSKLISNEEGQIFPSSDCVRSESGNGYMAIENSESFCTGPNDGRILDKEVEDGDSQVNEDVPTFSNDYSNHGAEIERRCDKNSEDGHFCAPNDAKSGIEVENGAVRGDNKSDHPEEHVFSEFKIVFGSFDPSPQPRPRQKARDLWSNDVELEVPNGDTKPTNGSDPGYHASDSHQNESLPDSKSEFVAEQSSAISSTDLPSNGDLNPTSEIRDGSVGGTETLVLNSSEKVEDELSGDGVTCDKATCMEDVVIDGVQSDGMPATLPESSTSDATDGQDVDKEVISRPFYYLMKIPRYEDDKLSEPIRHAQLQVDEKTQQRDAIRAEIQNKRTNCQANRERFEAAKAEERTARSSVKLKRQEIDSLQSVINRVRNAISVEEIDNRIYGLEHMIQHETLPLKEEKEFIREIKRLKHLQKELSSNMGSQDEVQHALGEKDQNEDHLKKLKKELETLKDTVLKAEAAKISAGKKYDEESKRLNELQAQFKAANDIRQEAYEHLSRLRGQLYAKNKNFGVYKDDAAAAAGYARADKEALHHLCVNQVEQLMELWIRDDEFRKEYARCNMRSTVRRWMTLDGRLLNPDEEPPVLPPSVDERVGRRLISVPSQIKSISVVANADEQEKQVSSAEAKQAGKRLIKEVVEQKIQTRGTAKHVVISGSATVSGRDDKIEDRKEEEEKIRKKEEEKELARRAEELKRAEELRRKAEIEAKEQRRLEEKAKAQEALERKKRNAEKAQKKAELRAQKEAEEREKSREKRLRKKEKKKSGSGNEVVPDNNSNAAETSGMTSIAKELEVKKESNSNRGTSKKKATKASAAWFAKQKKISKPTPIPAPLLNRGKRRMQPWMWVVIVAVFVVPLLFLLGDHNADFFPNLKLHWQ